MSESSYKNLSIQELIAKKKSLNTTIYVVLFGLLLFGSVIFYLMYNGNKQVGDLLFFIPVIGFILAMYAGRNYNQINTELQKRLK